MSRPQGGRIQVPDDLREILLEFTISYLLEQPGDVINYAVEFFTRLQNNRTTTIVRGPSAGTPDESIISDEEGIYSSISHRSTYDTKHRQRSVIRAAARCSTALPSFIAM